LKINLLCLGTSKREEGVNDINFTNVRKRLCLTCGQQN